jgi:hypothetical protein
MLRYVLWVAVLGTTVARASAQDAPAHVWLDLNETTERSPQKEQSFSFSKLLFDEQLTTKTTYPRLPRRSGLDFEAGVQLHRLLGVGVHVAPIHHDRAVLLDVSVPDPELFLRFHTARLDARLPRTDRALDLAGVFFVPTPNRLRLRVFAGPSHFSVSQEMVETFDYTGLRTITITSYTKQTVQGEAWGYHVGGDVAVFVLRNVGLGVGVRVSRVRPIDVGHEPFTKTAIQLTADRVTIGGGLRMRF